MGCIAVGVVILLANIAFLPDRILGDYQRLSPPKSFDDLKEAVTNEVYELLSEEITKVNNTVTYISSQLDTCSLDIEDQKTQCVDCVRLSCEQRIETLQCGVEADTAVETYESGKLECIIFKPLCKLKKTQEKVVKAIKKIGDGAKKIFSKIGKGVKKLGKQIKEAVKKIGEGVKKLAKGIGKVAKKAGEAIKKGVKKLAEGAKKVAKKIVDGAKKIGKKIVDGVKKAGKKVAEGVKKVGKKIVGGAKKVVKKVAGGAKKVARKVVRVVRRVFRTRRWGRRRRQTEPTCGQLEKDENACSFYQSQCTSCFIFGSPGTDVEPEDLIRKICGQDVLDGYIGLESLVLRIETLVDVINTFELTGVSFDSTSFKGAGFERVRAEYRVNNQIFTVPITAPIVPHNAFTAAPVIAKDIVENTYSSTHT